MVTVILRGPGTTYNDDQIQEDDDVDGVLTKSWRLGFELLLI